MTSYHVEILCKKKASGTFFIELLLLFCGLQPDCPLWPLTSDINKVFSSTHPPLIVFVFFFLSGPSSTEMDAKSWKSLSINIWFHFDLQPRLAPTSTFNTFKASWRWLWTRPFAWKPLLCNWQDINVCSYATEDQERRMKWRKANLLTGEDWCAINVSGS